MRALTGRDLKEEPSRLIAGGLVDGSMALWIQFRMKADGERVALYGPSRPAGMEVGLPEKGRVWSDHQVGSAVWNLGQAGLPDRQPPK
jgi:hypothetical protein